MRELIYLSDRKLSQFRQERRHGFRVREIGVPGVGQVGVEPNADSHLDDVIDYLSGTARWYQDEGLAFGDWIQFEATLSYTVFAGEDFQPALFFVEAEGPGRLILHGSPQHLVGSTSPPVTELPWLNVSARLGLEALLTVLTGEPRRDVQFRRLFARFGDPFDPDAAAPMTGFARITYGDRHGAVVASPLFVAYDRQ
jgi:hypothetical protein